VVVISSVVQAGSVTVVASCSAFAAEWEQELTEISAAALVPACSETPAVAVYCTVEQALTVAEVTMVHCWMAQ